MRQHVQTAISQNPDPTAAVAELRQHLGAESSALICFCSSHYDLQALGRALDTNFSCPILACSSAGEIIHSHGYVEKSVVAMAFAPGSLSLDVLLLQPLKGQDRQLLLNSFHRRIRDAGPADFALLLCDGLCGCEEQLIAFLQQSLGCVPVVGGSAGDDLRFEQTQVYYQGRFHSNAAVIGLCRSYLKARPFQIQHFSPTQGRLVITHADPAQRLVQEIDGIPAAQAYAAAIGCHPSELSPSHFARHPLMLRLAGTWYVRSVQQGYSDGSLRFYCAIEEGLVLTLGVSGDLAASLAEDLQHLCQQGSQAIIAFDCILRRIEGKERHMLAQMEAAIHPYPLLGMSSYGEQCQGIHVNHTMTGLILGEGP